MDTFEKKYNEALERAKAYHRNELAGSRKEMTEYIFPELRESEDEKIIREFNNWLCEEIECRTNDLRDEKDRRTLNMLCYILTKVKDWLEKQKEPTTEELYAEAGTTEKEYIANTMKMVRAMREKQKEQKPEDKEITLTNFEEVLNTFLFDFANSPIEDCEPKEYTKKHSAEILKAAYAELNAQLKQDIFEAQQEGRREGYEAAKAEQKPAEWSEEDEKMVKFYVDDYNNNLGNMPMRDVIENRIKFKDWLLNRLKSLRPQPKQGKKGLILTEEQEKKFGHLFTRPSWKPSEEQMKGLKFFLDFHRPQRNAGTTNWREYDAVESLYEQLKKL